MLPLLKSDANILASRRKSFILNSAVYNIANDPDVWPKGKPRSLGRYPTREEIRFIAYSALMQGSQGVIFNCYRFEHPSGAKEDISPTSTTPEGRRQWRVVSSVASELSALSPVLTAPREKNSGVAVSGAAVEWIVKQHQGRHYVFVTNPSSQPVQVSVKLAPQSFRSPIVRRYETGETLAPDGHSFAHRLAPYGVEIHEILR
ncbi:MAG TPA: hypothetical protein VFM39_08480 [bacterium]|nr:hypothetical protein [bacterium]